MGGPLGRQPPRTTLGEDDGPVVLDELNMIKNLHHHYRAYGGGWSWALQDYTALNFTKHLDDKNTLTHGQNNRCLLVC